MFEGGDPNFPVWTGIFQSNQTNITTPFSPVVTDPSDKDLIFYDTNSGLWKNGAFTSFGTLPTGGTAGQVLTKDSSTNYDASWQDNIATATKAQTYVKNDQGSVIYKGQAVYTSGSDGTNVTVKLALATSDLTSARTLGLLAQDLAVNQKGWVITEGILDGLDTSSANAGDTIYLSPTTAGGSLYGFANKPHAPAHLVYLGVVTKKSAGNGEVAVKVQNGYELDEIHNVDNTTSSPANGDILSFTTGITSPYGGTVSLWQNKSLASAGIASSSHIHGNVLNGGTMTTSVTATNPVKMVIANSTDTLGLLTTTNAGTTTFLRGDGTWVTPTDTYPTAWTWTAGTAAGPTASITGTSSSISVAAIPAAGSSASGILTTGTQTIAGTKTLQSTETIFQVAATQDSVKIAGRAGGTSSYGVTITPTTLTANRTLTAPNVSGTIVTTGDTGSVTSTMIADGTVAVGDLATATQAYLVPTGAIMMWYTDTPPTGWLLCDGQSTAGYTALAAIVGATVPDMRTRVPVGKGASGTFNVASGTTGGAETSSHSHTLSDNGLAAITVTNGGTGGSYRRATLSSGNWTANFAITYGANVTTSTTVGTTGAALRGTTDSGDSSTLQPYIVLNYIIKT